MSAVLPPMKRIATAVSMAMAASAFTCSMSVQAESLGTIQVESSTIGDRFADKRLEPSSVSAISGETVDRSHTQNIQQLLQSIPGITTEVQSGDSLKIHIRGVENQVFMGEKPGVAVVIDGVPVFERTGKVNIDLDNIESIRVIKGGASYLFGDDALSGAVIITTKKGARHAGYKVAAEAGSHGFHKELVRAGFSSENASGHVQVSQREVDGYYDDSASQADYVNGKLQYYIDEKSDLQFGFEIAEREKNSHGSVTGFTAAALDPVSANLTAYNDYANHFEVALDKYFLTYNRDLLDDATLTINTYQFTDQTDYHSDDLAADPTKYADDNDYLQIQRGVKAEYRVGGESLAWMLATDLRDNEYNNTVIAMDCSEISWGVCNEGEAKKDDTTDEKVTAFYGELKYRPMEKWLLTLNGRTDRIDLDYRDHLDDTDNGSKEFKVFSSRIGANYAASENMDYYASASTGFRAPSVTQLFVGSSHPDMRVDANPDLEPETATNLEIGLRRKGNLMGIPVELDMALFQLDREDHIQASAGQYTTADGNRYENVGDMRSRGLELSLLGQPSKRWSWDLAYTYLDAFYTRYNEFNLQTEPLDTNPANPNACVTGATPVVENVSFFGPPNWQVTNCLTAYDNTGNQVPRTPKHHLNLAVNVMPASGWTITGEMDAISGYYADEINRIKIDGHQVFNLLVNHDRKIGRVEWNFFARVDNLLDEQYLNTARGYSDSNDDGFYNGEDLSLVVNQGRTFTAGISAKF